ncbi:MAG: hypothetical protein ACI9G1_001879 [Pirellulaceae bacterium]|jgi:hypothetical protein
MANHSTTWEDDDCNRIVQLSVEYQTIDNRIEIEDVTPTSVRFLDATGTTQREVRVWTQTGCRLLRQQHAQRVGATALAAQIEAELAAIVQ